MDFGQPLTLYTSKVSAHGDWTCCVLYTGWQGVSSYTRSVVYHVVYTRFFFQRQRLKIAPTGMGIVCTFFGTQQPPLEQKKQKKKTEPSFFTFFFFLGGGTRGHGSFTYRNIEGANPKPPPPHPCIHACIYGLSLNLIQDEKVRPIQKTLACDLWYR